MFLPLEFPPSPSWLRSTVEGYPLPLQMRGFLMYLKFCAFHIFLVLSYKTLRNFQNVKYGHNEIVSESQQPLVIYI